jgi:hypothetical protein
MHQPALEMKSGYPLPAMRRNCPVVSIAALDTLACLVQKSKDCPYVFAKGLKTPTGNATWHLGESIPDSTVYIRAFLMCPPAADGTVKYCAYGNSKGFIQVCCPGN